MKNVIVRCVVSAVLMMMTVRSAAQDQSGVGEPSRWFVGSDFRFYFDNMEGAGCDVDESGTTFSARLSPYLGFKWDRYNRLTFGVDVRQDFGDSVSFVSDVKPMLYYTYKSRKWEVNAGLFPRKHLCGDYGEILYDTAIEYMDNLIGGLAGNYHGDNGFVEAAINWEGMYSEKRREKFRILSAGEYDWRRHWQIGYTFAMTHLAKSSRNVGSGNVNAPATIEEGVVDYIFVNPYIGATFKAFFDWEMRAHAFISVQRDRIVEERRTPVGGQFDLILSKWNFRLHNEFYYGKNQMPFYDKYGTLLYSSCRYYTVPHNIYDHLGLDYVRSFKRSGIDLCVSFEAHFDGKNAGLQQMVTLGINVEKMFKMR